MQNVKIELTSENDLFFHYTHIVDDDSFRHMQENQKLNENERRVEGLLQQLSSQKVFIVLFKTHLILGVN